MDDALSADELRALAFASIPQELRRSYSGAAVEEEKEEGEVSSDDEVPIEKGVEGVRLPRNFKLNAKRKENINKKAALQSSPLSIEVPHLQNLVAAPTVSQVPAANKDLPKQVVHPILAANLPLRNLQPPLEDKEKNGWLMGTGAKTHPTSVQLLGKNTTQKSVTNNNNNTSDNPFLIKFSDDDSDGESDATLRSAPEAAISKPANLSVEIDRMKKQIAAIERVKGKSLPLSKSVRHPSTNLRPSLPGPAPRTFSNSATQTNLDVLRKQIAWKQSEIQQQQRQRKEVLANNLSVPVSSSSGLPATGVPVASVTAPASNSKHRFPGDFVRTPTSNNKFNFPRLDSSVQGGVESNGFKRGSEHTCEQEMQASNKKQKTVPVDAAPMVENESAACPNVLPEVTKSVELMTVDREHRAVTRGLGSKQSLEELQREEEALDKELEAAQQHRHMWEIRERLARKAYREAQETLRIATANCDKLYRRREMISLRVRAAEMKYDISEGSLMQPESLPDGLNVLALTSADQTGPSDDLPTVDVLRKPEEAVLTRSGSGTEDKKVDAEQIRTENNCQEMEPVACTNLVENGAASFIDAMTDDSAGDQIFSKSAVEQTFLDSTVCNQSPVVHEGTKVPELSSMENPKETESPVNSREDDEELQGSSSSAAELKNKIDVVVGNDLETLAREPVVIQSSLELLEDNGIGNGTKHGSSAGSSVETTVESLGNTVIAVETRDNALSDDLQVPKMRRTRLRAGRVVAFQHFFSRSDVSTSLVPEETKTLEGAPESYGEYQSPLKFSKTLESFKPLCKYEHRGKCNNELCGFQHVNGHRQRSRQDEQDHTSTCEKNNQASWLKFTVPAATYRIATYLVRDWQEISHTRFFKVLSDTPVSSSYAFLTRVSMQRPLLLDMPCILDDQTQVLNESIDFSEAELSNGKLMLARDPSADSCLDLAVNILQYDVNLKSTNCLRNALCVLSRALEVNKTSSSLWMVYLVLFSMGGDATKKNDDIFLHAVRFNKHSYDLWCLALASRSNLGELLELYNTAILALCDGSRSFEDGNNSACILDLVLRLFYVLAMSGQDALKWIDCLVYSEGSENRCKISPAVWRNLQAADACVLWVCCAYFCAYGTLPGIVVSRLGCKQDLLLTLEWETPGMVIEDTRSKVLSILKTATSSLSSAGSVDDVVATEVLAVNFMKFLVAFEDLEHAAGYGEQAVQLHPCSVELVVLCANVKRLREGCTAALAFFQSALKNWPNKKPGIQALLNQYAGHALEWEGEECALVILQDYLTKEARNGQMSGDSTSTSSESAEDCTFSLVNRALLEMLSGKTHEAQVALEKALSSTNAGTHCWLEFAAFRISATGGHDFQRVLASVLDRCHIQSQLASKLTPLGRGFLKNIKKSRLRCFIDTLLGHSPSDFSLVNSLLRMCFGPELLPSENREFVTQIGAGLLELFPANSVLALAFCKALKICDNANSATSAWAASLVVTSLRLSVASEALWLEAGDLLQQLGLEDCCESFYRHALAAYPFSASLWRRYIRRATNREGAIESAKEAGLIF